MTSLTEFSSYKGIGPEISAAVQRIFKAANVPIQWETVDVTPIMNAEGKTSIPKIALDSINRNKIALKGINSFSTFKVRLIRFVLGPLATPIGKGISLYNPLFLYKLSNQS